MAKSFRGPTDNCAKMGKFPGIAYFIDEPARSPSRAILIDTKLHEPVESGAGSGAGLESRLRRTRSAR